MSELRCVRVNPLASPLLRNSVSSQAVPAQVQLYNAVVQSTAVASLLSNPSAACTSVLPIITKLRKLCNSPALLHDPDKGADTDAGLLDLYPPEFDPTGTESSGTYSSLLR